MGDRGTMKEHEKKLIKFQRLAIDMYEKDKNPNRIDNHMAGIFYASKALQKMLKDGELK